MSENVGMTDMILLFIIILKPYPTKTQYFAEDDVQRKLYNVGTRPGL